jgi:hypothetical protein
MTVAEMKQRAEVLSHAMDGVPRTWRLGQPSPERTRYLARVGWFHELYAGLYEPIANALVRLRNNDSSGLESLVRFLEADVYCFRSGYMKEEIIRLLARADLETETAQRLRTIVLAVVDGFDRREFRYYIRLARRVDSVDFRSELRGRLTSESPRTVRHAEWMLAGLDDPVGSQR